MEKGDGLKIISGNIWYSDISDFQPEHVNPGSSESDLMSDKMKEGVIICYDNIIITITYLSLIHI